MANEAQLEAKQSLHAQMAEKGTKLQQVDAPPAPSSLEVAVKVEAGSREYIAPAAYGAVDIGMPVQHVTAGGWDK